MVMVMEDAFGRWTATERRRGEEGAEWGRRQGKGGFLGRYPRVGTRTGSSNVQEYAIAVLRTENRGTTAGLPHSIRHPYHHHPHSPHFEGQEESGSPHAHVHTHTHTHAPVSNHERLEIELLPPTLRQLKLAALPSPVLAPPSPFSLYPPSPKVRGTKGGAATTAHPVSVEEVPAEGDAQRAVTPTPSGESAVPACGATTTEEAVAPTEFVEALGDRAEEDVSKFGELREGVSLRPSLRRREAR